MLRIILAAAVCLLREVSGRVSPQPSSIVRLVVEKLQKYVEFAGAFVVVLGVAGTVMIAALWLTLRLLRSGREAQASEEGVFLRHAERRRRKNIRAA
jgi:hypothetical protein